MLDGREVTPGFEVRQTGAVRPSSLPSQFFANAVEDGLPQVRLQGTGTARLELPNPLKCLKERFLDKVVGVADVTGPFRQPARCPPLQRADVACKEPVDRLLVAGTRAL